ncbi:hypothetical protein HY522_09780 [bacterium]|nr:hypothetical protein [bacterium]
MVRGEHLFSKYDLRAVLDNQGRKMVEEIDAIPGERLLATSPAAWGEYFEKKYQLGVPRLKRDEITVDQAEDEIDVSQHHNRFIRDRSRPFHLKGTSFSFFVPFDGEPEFFHCQPSTYTSAPPTGQVEGNELTMSYVELKDADPAAIRANFDREIGDVQGYLEWIEKDVAPFNASIKAEAMRRIETRRTKLLKDQAVVGGLGFARRRPDAPETYAVPTVRRKAPVRTPSEGKKPNPPEPTLVMEEYEHILSVISNMVHVMERSPKAFAGMDEEALRQHFLVQLNGQYEGQATGETFNFEGKTDILIRTEGRNVFIAECKFWRGSESVREATDQILRYTSWRDTKTAVLLFNRTKNLSAVLAKVPEIIRSHPQFVRETAIDGETQFRFILHHRDDNHRELILTLLMFEIPT